MLLQMSTPGHNIAPDTAAKATTFSCWQINHSLSCIEWSNQDSKQVNNVVKWKSTLNFQTLQREHINIHHVSLLIYCFLHSSSFITFYTITKSMHAFWLVNRLWFIVPVNPWKNRASSELLYKSNRLQVSMVYRLINHLGCW